MKYIFHEPAAYCRWRKCLLIMRLTIILLIAFVLHAGARGTAQTVTLSVTNMPLEKVCKEIEHQTGYYFVYAKDLTSESHLVSVKVVSASIGETLRQLFYGLPFSWQVINRVVVVNTVKANPRMVERLSSSQGEKMMKVEGIVQNEDGQPITEASVTIRATGKGTLTNENGRFFFPSLEAGSVLVISHIGYSDQIVLVKDNFLTVNLPVAVKGLNATVVKGYYKTSNKLNTGSVATVSGEDIARQPVTDPLLALEGRVPGLYISQTSGAPGAYSTIQLRGQNSIYTSAKPITANDPLFIVDGVPFSSQTLTDPYYGGGLLGRPFFVGGQRQGMSPFNYLNPADIERIDILKDGDATAIYGSRGANGVIIITTKKGKVGQTKININVSTGASKVTRKLDLLNTHQYLNMRYEALKNDNFYQYLVPEYAMYFPDIMIWDSTRYTDWQKVLISQPNNFTNAQASISGGNTSTQFAIGAGYTRQGVVFPGRYADQKGSIHFSLSNTSPNNRLVTQLSAFYSYDNSNLPGVDPTQNITLAPDAPALFDANGNLNWQVFNGGATFDNPLSYTAAYARAISHFLSGNLQLNYQIFSRLHLSSNFGFSRGQLNQTNISPSNSFPPPNDFPSLRSSVFGSTEIDTWIIEPQASYLARIGKGQLDLLVGGTFQENTAKSNTVIATGFSSDALITNPLAASSSKVAGNNFTLYRYNAFYGKINYNWKETYLLNITARRDGSSRFGPGKQFGNFGAVGIGWVFSKERFIQDILPRLDFGKIRISYGSTGNDQIIDYQYMSTYTPNGLSYQGVTGLYPTRMPNPYFAWERVNKMEAGLDIGILANKVLISVDYYRNRTKDQLVGFPLPYFTGFTNVQGNLPALIQNAGVECGINTTAIKKRDLTWNIAVNFSLPRNKLVAYPGIEKTSYATTYAVGHSIFSRFVYHYIGVDPQTGLYRVLSKSSNGIPKFPEDLIVSKPITQSYHGGIQNTIIYKGFQLDFLIQFVKQLGYSYITSFDRPGIMNQNVPVLIMNNHWQKAGDAAVVQRFTQGSYYPADQANGLFTSSDGVIVDQSFARLKNVNISYHLPGKWKDKASLQEASLFVQCQNLLTITKFAGMDPETGGLNLPPMRTIVLGFNVTF